MLFAGAPLAARADLYRWVDPETGSVKFSNFPPPEGRSANVVPFRGAAPERMAPAEKIDGQAPLEQSRRFLQQALLQTGLDPAGRATLEKQAQAYVAVSRQLDQLDPAGAERRRAEDAALFEKMRAAAGPQARPAGEPTKGTP